MRCWRPWARRGAGEGVLVQGQVDKRLVVDTLLPDHPERFSWAGHLGLRMLPAVVRELESTTTTLVFVNVRSQAELWYKAILDARPDWAGELAIHHGSLDRGVREWVEAGLKEGRLRAVVCTSSLDLGVDFLPVERVLQIGSAKGIARLLQRAGRSGHAPGRPSRITLVPTHSLELVEAAAARAAVQAGEVEMRASPRRPVDVLVQHLVTVALGGGFEPEALYAEVRRTVAYRDLPRAVWQWCLDFVHRGGPSLAAYPDYQRVAPDEEGIWRMPSARLARRHRANIGTIVSDASMAVQVLHGARLGTMEESFLSRLSPGDCFVFAGQVLEMVKIEDMTAYVRRAARGRPTVPRWAGSRMPLSTVLADFVVQQLAQAAAGRYGSPELRCVRPLLEVQQRWSALPTPGTLLAETLRTREGWHLFLYPFAGRHAHIGLASLFRVACRPGGGRHVFHRRERLTGWSCCRRPSATGPPCCRSCCGYMPRQCLRGERYRPAGAAGRRSPGHPQYRERRAGRGRGLVRRQRDRDRQRPAGRGAPRAAARGAGQPQRHRNGPAPVPGNRTGRRAHLSEPSWRAPQRAAVAGVVAAVLRGFPQVRRRQHAPAPGRRGSAEPGAGRGAAAGGAAPHAGAGPGGAAAGAAQPVRFPAHGGTLPGKAHQRGPGRPHRAHAGAAGHRRRRGRYCCARPVGAGCGASGPARAAAAQAHRGEEGGRQGRDTAGGVAPAAQTAMQQAADAVRRTLDFSLTSAEDGGTGAAGDGRSRRRERKPSRPLPRL